MTSLPKSLSKSGGSSKLLQEIEEEEASHYPELKVKYEADINQLDMITAGRYDDPTSPDNSAESQGQPKYEALWRCYGGFRSLTGTSTISSSKKKEKIESAFGGGWELCVQDSDLQKWLYSEPDCSAIELSTIKKGRLAKLQGGDDASDSDQEKGKNDSKKEAVRWRREREAHQKITAEKLKKEEEARKKKEKEEAQARRKSEKKSKGVFNKIRNLRNSRKVEKQLKAKKLRERRMTVREIHREKEKNWRAGVVPAQKVLRAQVSFSRMQNATLALPGSTSSDSHDPLLVVSVLGEYGVGKTWLGDKLLSTQRPPHEHVPTEGLTFWSGKKSQSSGRQNWILVDTPGLEAPARGTTPSLSLLFLSLYPFFPPPATLSSPLSLLPS